MGVQADIWLLRDPETKNLINAKYAKDAKDAKDAKKTFVNETPHSKPAPE